MATTYRLTDPGSKQQLITDLMNGQFEPRSAEPVQVQPELWRERYQWMEKKLEEARQRHLFQPDPPQVLQYENADVRAELCTAAVVSRPFLSDRLKTHIKIFPECGVHYERLFSAHVFRTPVLVVGELEHHLLQLVSLRGVAKLTPELLATVLRFCSAFEDYGSFLDYMVLMGRDGANRADKAFLSGQDHASEVLQDLAKQELQDPLRTAVYLHDIGYIDDPHPLWFLLDGHLQVASHHCCHLHGRWIYLLMPRKIYSYGEVVAFSGFDLVFDPINSANGVHA